MGAINVAPIFERFSLRAALDWVDLFSSVGVVMPGLWKRLQSSGAYEILDYDSTLELLDVKGEMAVFTRTQKVKFLQDNVIAYQDHAWGDGELFADYACSPGVVVDKYQDGERWNVLISLRETKHKGDVVVFRIERTVKSGFMKADEWRQTTVQFPTKCIRLSIIFPKDRPCRRAILLQKSRNKTLVFGHEHFLNLPDGRQSLTWEAKNPRLHETYTMKWQW